MDTLNIYYDKIGSTNSEAKNILLKHNIKKAVIIADEQTSGKGRYGNKWISKKGNLYMSLVFQVKSYNHIKLLQFKILKLLKLFNVFFIKVLSLSNAVILSASSYELLT